VRACHAVEDALRSLLKDGDLALPQPRGGSTARRWGALARWGRSDLAVARLAEGHTDALAILAEAGLTPQPDALYGVWAARPGGVGPTLVAGPDGPARVAGLARFCSGARMLDRALLVARPEQSESEPLLVEVELDRTRVSADPDSWRADGMAGSDTLDVRFADAAVDRLVGDAGWYTRRPGFAAGGGGVAAVWWGGAAGLLDRASAHVAAAGPDPHQLAHLGELHAMLAASHALLRATADELDALPGADHGLAVATVRSAVELCCRAVVDRVPRVLGPTPWSGDAQLAEMLADLQMYVRQHHGERDNAALAAALLRERDR
jgi:hypothetical protein